MDNGNVPPHRSMASTDQVQNNHWSDAIPLASHILRRLDLGRNMGPSAHSGDVSLFEMAEPDAGREGLPRRGRPHVPAFASLSTSIAKLKRRARLKQTFDEIDTGNKGFVTQQDLSKYAHRHGLPEGYVPAFMAAVAATEAEARAGVSRGGGGGVAVLPQPKRIQFKAFNDFVTSREDGLRDTFDNLDTDGNGCLSAEELQAALRAVRVRCPSTRRVYHCRQEAVADMLRRRDKRCVDSIGFEEFRQFFLLLPAGGMLADYRMNALCAGICDVGASVAIHEGSPWRHLVAGALAGAASRTATAPLETLRLQISKPQSIGVRPDPAANCRRCVEQPPPQPAAVRSPPPGAFWRLRGGGVSSEATAPTCCGPRHRRLLTSLLSTFSRGHCGRRVVAACSPQQV
mmetsp:Transcript_6446/g.18596  ORF Transcript_6446/g.18596 Transcript_6446/m.18596 type:complete len:401 (+) Transcript_6446:487-1689(+)